MTSENEYLEGQLRLWNKEEDSPASPETNSNLADTVISNAGRIALIRESLNQQVTNTKEQDTDPSGNVQPENKELSPEEIEKFYNSREDPYGSLGGGRETYLRLGRLPSGRTEKDISMVTINRGDGSYFKLTLGNKQLLVKVLEDGDNSGNISRAKQKLLDGGGDVIRKRRKKN